MAAHTGTVLISDPNAAPGSLNDISRAKWNRVLAVCEERVGGFHYRLLYGLGRDAGCYDIYDM